MQTRSLVYLELLQNFLFRFFSFWSGSLNTPIVSTFISTDLTFRKLYLTLIFYTSKNSAAFYNPNYKAKFFIYAKNIIFLEPIFHEIVNARLIEICGKTIIKLDLHCKSFKSYARRQNVKTENAQKVIITDNLLRYESCS